MLSLKISDEEEILSKECLSIYTCDTLLTFLIYICIVIQTQEKVVLNVQMSEQSQDYLFRTRIHKTLISFFNKNLPD